MTAYRELRKSGKVEQQQEETMILEDMNDFSMLHGSPEKSFFSSLRQKSASRSKSRTNTGQQQVRKSSAN
jgi:hypothetical protein